MSKGNITDLVKLRVEIREGIFEPYIKRGSVYLKDVENGETILICHLSEVQNG